MLCKVLQLSMAAKGVSLVFGGRFSQLTSAVQRYGLRIRTLEGM
jgi:hypothetical protein